MLTSKITVSDKAERCSKGETLVLCAWGMKNCTSSPSGFGMCLGARRTTCNNHELLKNFMQLNIENFSTIYVKTRFFVKIKRW
jgi:hypothetical protein